MSVKSVLSLFIFLFLFSCSKQPQVTNLSRAELLIEVSPDSALYVLRQIDDPEQFSKREYALYCLLLTQAEDKNYIKPTSDSLISIAADYYKDGDDPIKAAKAYYALGRINHELKINKKAVQSYLKALTIAEKTNEYELLGLITSNLGKLYWEQRLNNEALIANKQALYYFQLTNNKINLCYSLRNLGRNYTFKGKKDSALVYYTKALKMAKETRNVRVITSILDNLSYEYNAMGEYDMALSYNYESINYIDKTKVLKTYFSIGQIYAHKQEYDSAMLYLNKSSESNDLNTKLGSYKSLYKLAILRDSLHEAVSYSDLYLVYVDSMLAITPNKVIAELQQKNQFEKQQKDTQISKLTQKKDTMISYLTLVIVLSLILLGLCVGLFMRELRLKRNSLNKSVERVSQYKVEVSLLDKHIERLQEILLSESEVVKKIRNIDQTADLTKKKVAFSEREWIELTNVFSIYSNFTDNLKRVFPKLNADDIQLCCLMRLGVSTCTILYLLQTNAEALARRKNRMKKDKMDLSEEKASLDMIIRGF